MDLDEWARGEGFRDNQHRNDWYAGKAPYRYGPPESCALMLAAICGSILVVLAERLTRP